MKIKNKLITGQPPCFIIAEAGVNHNGSLELAKKLVDAAKEAGADAVKFQTFLAEDLVAWHAEMAEYQEKNTGKNESQLEMLKKLELSYRDFLEIKKYCDKRGIIFLSTPHTEGAADFLEPLMPAYKVASGDLTNLPLLKKIAKKQKCIILSTGMSNLDEIEVALSTIRKISKNKISLLQCTTNYPCSMEDVNLRVMLTFKEKFEKKFSPLEIGYSDHTEGIFTSVAAVAMGARVIEKHFTLDKNLPGPDHKASLEPRQLKEMLKIIRETEIALGNGIKIPTKNEQIIKKIARKSIIAKEDISKGEKITSEMLSIKRPGTGIEPKNINKIIGRKAKTDIKKDQFISWEII